MQCQPRIFTFSGGVVIIMPVFDRIMPVVNCRLCPPAQVIFFLNFNFMRVWTCNHRPCKQTGRRASYYAPQSWPGCIIIYLFANQKFQCGFCTLNRFLCVKRGKNAQQYSHCRDESVSARYERLYAETLQPFPGLKRHKCLGPRVTCSLL